MRCAESFNELGLKQGDVIVVMAPNHLDLCIPMYAAFYLGVIVAALDPGSSVGMIKQIVSLTIIIIFVFFDTFIRVYVNVDAFQFSTVRSLLDR